MLRLLEHAAELMDLRHPLREGTVGDMLEYTLRSADRRDNPCRWLAGEADAGIRMLASSEQCFFYTPHLFPDMDPVLAKAHELQYALLPGTGLRSPSFRMAAVLESFCHLSGDVFGWEQRENDTLRVFLMDTSGHGIRAGLLAALVKILMDDVRDVEELPTLARELNRRLEVCLRNSGDVLYAVGAILELRPQSLRYVSAAHPALLLRDVDGEVRALPTAGRPLGVFSHSTYDVHEQALHPGDVLLLSTDGLLESGNARGEEYGLGRLATALSRMQGPAMQVARGIHEHLAGWLDLNTIDDDVAFMVVEHI